MKRLFRTLSNGEENHALAMIVGLAALKDTITTSIILSSYTVLLLTTIGRRTGKKRITPLGYLEHDGSYVITATNAGFDTHPAWFHNLKSHPQVALQIGDKQLTAIADLADPTLRQQLWAKFVERAPGYGAHEKRTTREIPIVLLRPVSLRSA